MKAPDQANGTTHVEALQKYNLLEAIPEQALDDLTALAAHLCEVPIALISIVDADRHWFKSKVGTSLTETPREIAFCEYAIRGSGLFIVSDASKDKRFADNPLVTGEPKIRFYAAVPLITPEGEPLGTLSIVDQVPRELTPVQQDRLRALGRQAMAQLELRRRSRELSSRKRLLRSIFSHAPDCINLLKADGTMPEINGAGLRMLEADSEEQLTNVSVFSFVVPEHRADFGRLVEQAFGGEAGHLRFELVGLRGGRRWAETHAAPFYDENGSVSAVLAVSRDITALIRAEEQRKDIEGRNEALVKALREVVYDWRPLTNEIIWSGSYTSVLGYSPEEIGNTTESWSSRIHPEDLSAALLEIEQATRERRNYDFEYRFRHRDGTYLWVHDRGVLTISSAGELSRVIGVCIEITARKKAENELRESEALFHTLAAAVPVGIIRTDTAGHCIYVNERWVEICELTAEAAKQNRWVETLHPDDRERIASEWQRAVALGQTFASEFRFVRANGRITWVLGQGVAERTETGKGRGYIVTLTDITERKVMEDALRRSQEHLSSIVQSVDGIVWEAEADTFEFTFVSKSAERLLGYPASQWMEEPTFWVDHLHPEDRDRAAMLCRESAREKRPHEFEYRMFAVDGRAVWLRDIVTVVVENDKAVKLRGIMFDISAQKLAENSLRAASDRYTRQRTALTALTRSRVLQAVDLHAAIREITEVAARTLEVERVSVWTFNSAHTSLVCLDLFERSSGRHSSGFELKQELYPSYFEALGREDILSAHDAQTDPRTAEFTQSYLRPLGIAAMMDASIRMAGVSTGVLCHEHTSGLRQWTLDEESFAISVANLVSLLLAQSERGRFEEQLRQAQKFEAIGQLAGGVAHDFNNILAVILMQTDLSMMSESMTPEARSAFEEIRSAADRAANLTRQLLLFSRKQVMQARELDLNEVITNMTRMLRRLIGADILLQLHLHPSVLTVHADAGMLDQVLLNLAVNARDAMPQGGVLLIETSLRVVDEDIARTNLDASQGAYVCLTVTDTGAGMAPDVLPRIFEPFFTTKEPGKGTGLGLATVFGIVKQHRGWIQVSSELGKGTTFHIHFPSAWAAPAPAERVPEPKPRGGSETILLAEDDAAVRRLTRQVLERHGYSVLEASDGMEAMKLWEKNIGTVKLLMTDLVMPGGISGQQLARSLQEENPELKIILISGYSAEIAGKDLEVHAGELFLQKPCSQNQLLDAVRRALGHD
jgi:PAS domain S-box-containing protein